MKLELQTLLWPLLCHIYIEMIKGRESRPAAEFLRKYAHLIGPIENLNSPVASKVNGKSSDDVTQIQAPDQQQDQKDAFSIPLPSGTTQIIFAANDPKTVSEASKTVLHNAKSDTELNSNDISDYFKELVQSLSLCLRIDEIESIEITRNFRSAKYEMVLSLQALYAMKNFLAKGGHVIILHILQNWFSLDIREFLSDSENDEEDMDDEEIESSEASNNCVENNGSDGSQHHLSDGEEFNFRDANSRTKSTHSEIKNLLTKVESEIKTVNRLNSSIVTVDVSTDIDVANKTDSFPIPSIADSLPAVAPERPSFNVVQNKYLQNVRASVIRSRKLEMPMRVFNLLNADHALSCTDIDKNECHLACGFSDSTIKLWQLNQSIMRGRKPFSPFSNRLCEWCLDNCESSSSGSDSDGDADELNHGKRASVMGLFVRRKPKVEKKSCGISITGTYLKSKKEQKREFMEQRCDENILYVLFKFIH